MLMFFLQCFLQTFGVLPGQAASKTPSAVPVQTRPAAGLGMGGISWLERSTMWHLLPEYETYQGLSSFIIHNRL